MKLSYLAFVAASLLAGCDPTAGTNTTGVPGYHFYDGMHQISVSSPSPQAIEAARRGVWLWPPTDNSRPD